MKLNSTQVKQTLRQMDAQFLPDDDPAVSKLIDVFGNHTFFLDASGLKVLEPTEELAETKMEIEAGEIVSLADWTDTSSTSLKLHAPEPTGTVVVFREIEH